MVIGDFGGTPHFFDHDEQMSIRLFHHISHRRVRRRDGDAGEIGGFEEMRRRILPDHADALRQVVDARLEPQQTGRRYSRGGARFSPSVTVLRRVTCSAVNTAASSHPCCTPSMSETC